jgi:dipeptidyl aminopeptidase/acylaminoacyl peptidase
MKLRALLWVGAIAFVWRGAVAISAADAPFTPDDHYRLKTASDVQLSPDGSRLAFVENSIDRQANRNLSRVWLLTIATGALTPLTPEGGGDTSPRWSPDGSSIALLSTADDKPAVVIANVRDGSRRTLVHYQSTTEPARAGPRGGRDETQSRPVCALARPRRERPISPSLRLGALRPRSSEPDRA